MQILADERFMLETTDEDVTFTDSAYWGLLRTWTAESVQIPRGFRFSLRSVADTSLSTAFRPPMHTSSSLMVTIHQYHSEDVG